MLGAVRTVLEVRLVVLGVVGDEVAQREAVMGRHEVDRRVRAAIAVAKEIRRTRQPVAQVPHAVAVAAPEIPHGVAEPVVPLRPGGWERAETVAA